MNLMFIYWQLRNKDYLKILICALTEQQNGRKMSVPRLARAAHDGETVTAYIAVGQCNKSRVYIDDSTFILLI